MLRLDETELTRWGERIGRTIETPAVLALRGPLGAGKSVLARAIGRGAGVEGPMPSPSYNLLLRYETPREVAVVHIDLYRIEAPSDLWELGWSDLGDGPEIVLIEWPERAEGLVPRDHWLVDLSVPEGHPDRRDVEVRRIGAPPALPGFPISVTPSGATSDEDGRP